jgi:hypothetical protein
MNPSEVNRLLKTFSTKGKLFEECIYLIAE